MSEYQYYEFLALDKPLTDRQRAELRKLSSRADITATRFVNEYNYGDFRGSPGKLMERYFDAFLYLANWGTRRLCSASRVLCSTPTSRGGTATRTPPR